jgi:hypothetical protein
MLVFWAATPCGLVRPDSVTSHKTALCSSIGLELQRTNSACLHRTQKFCSTNTAEVYEGQDRPSARLSRCLNRALLGWVWADSPPDHEIPLFSISTSANPVAAEPLPAVRLSPIAPMTSMSPGRRRCTLVGRVSDRPPGDPDPVLQGNGVSSNTGSWNLLCKTCSQ